MSAYPSSPGIPMSLTRTSGRKSRERLQRLGDRAGRSDLAPGRPQDLRHQIARVPLVLDEQDPDAAERPLLALDGRARCLSRSHRASASTPRATSGQPHDEAGAEARARALRRDRAAVKLDQVAGDREPDPEPALRARRRAVGLAEAVEDVGEELGRHARARVADLDRELALAAGEGDRHAPVRRRELDRVRDEVPDDLLQAVGVARRSGRRPPGAGPRTASRSPCPRPPGASTPSPPRMTADEARRPDRQARACP